MGRGDGEGRQNGAIHGAPNLTWYTAASPLKIEKRGLTD